MLHTQINWPASLPDFGCLRDRGDPHFGQSGAFTLGFSVAGPFDFTGAFAAAGDGQLSFAEFVEEARGFEENITLWDMYVDDDLAQQFEASCAPTSGGRPAPSKAQQSAVSPNFLRIKDHPQRRRDRSCEGIPTAAKFEKFERVI